MVQCSGKESVREEAMQLLIVEDDTWLAMALKVGCQEAGYQADIAQNGLQAREHLEKTAYAVVVLDLGLPDEDGLDILRFLRSSERYVPILVLTARDTVPDKVRGLKAGADDYLGKPFAFAELLARIDSLVRRSQQQKTTHLRAADVEIDLKSRRATRAGRELTLTPREFDLLVYLVQAAGQTVSREMIARDVWRITSRATPIDNIVYVHISHLRHEVDKNGEMPLIHTVRGVGFAFKAES